MNRNTPKKQRTHQPSNSPDTAYKIETTAEFLTLMNIYYSEWEHRDSLMWKQVTTFFSSVFVIILLPFGEVWQIPLVDHIPNIVFPFVGIALSFIFYYITIQYAHRLSKIGTTYRKMVDLLPKDLRREKIYEKNRVTRSRQLAYLVPSILFLALIIIGDVVLLLCLCTRECN